MPPFEIEFSTSHCVQSETSTSTALIQTGILRAVGVWIWRSEFSPVSFRLRGVSMSMPHKIFQRWFLSLLLLFIGTAAGYAQPAKEEYQPHVGQQGKDVVWVPTPQALVDRMLDLAKVTSKDYVIDLGS